MLSERDLLEVVAATPLVSVDLVLLRAGREVLLGQRTNRPAQGFWFVPGGRILKDETRLQAMARIAQREFGVNVLQYAPRFLGVYEHFYDDCFAGDVGVSTHYVVLAYWVEIPAGFEIGEGDDQHAELRWWPLELASCHGQVHPYTKTYLSSAQPQQCMEVR